VVKEQKNSARKGKKKGREKEREKERKRERERERKKEREKEGKKEGKKERKKARKKERKKIGECCALSTLKVCASEHPNRPQLHLYTPTPQLHHRATEKQK